MVSDVWWDLGRTVWNAVGSIFFVCFLFEDATQLALQVQQERTQVVCRNKVDRSRLALRHSRY